jgi:COMPASS component SWD3
MSAYIRLHDLDNGHSDSINCLAFSFEANYLASGADDHQVIIWNVRSGAAMFKLLFKSQVHCLLWHPLRTEVLICGLADGSIYEASDFSLVTSLICPLAVTHHRLDGSCRSTH